MSVAFHTHTVRCDANDLERAAGRLEIAAKASNDAGWANAAHGASVALYALSAHDIKSEEDMLTVWSMLMTNGVTPGEENEDEGF